MLKLNTYEKIGKKNRYYTDKTNFINSKLSSVNISSLVNIEGTILVT